MKRFSYSVNQARIYRLRQFALGAMLSMLPAFVSAQMAGNYTIDATSPASSSNFQDFTSAVQALDGQSRNDGGPTSGSGVSGPVVISVVPGSGPYYEQITIPPVSGASSNNTITFKGNGEVLEYEPTYNDRHIIHLKGADYIRLTDLTIRSLSYDYGWGVRLSNEANFNEVRDCYIDMSTPYTYYEWDYSHYVVGITLTNTGEYSYGYEATEPWYGGGGTTGLNNKFVGNTIQGNQYDFGMWAGIAINGDYPYQPNDNYNTIVDSNEIRNFRHYGIQAYCAGGGKFRGNNIHNEGSSSYAVYYFYGIYSYEAANIMDANKIHDPFPNGSNTWSEAYGIYHYRYNPPAGSVVMSNNSIYNFNNGGYYYYGILADASGEVIHNTINISGSTYAYSAYGIMAYDYNSGGNAMRIQNNNIFVTSTSDRYCLYYGGQNMANASSDNNNLYRGTTGGGYTGYFNSVSTTLANWQGVTQKDMNSVAVDPQFTSPATGNLIPRVLDLDGAGTSAGIARDINGVTRNVSNPDIGSHEFDIPVNVTSITYPATICQGEIVDVRVNIQNTSSVNVSNFKVCYTINNVLMATETVTGTLNAGASTSYTFQMKVNNNQTGNFALRAFVRGKTPAGPVNYTVNPSPVGSLVSKGSVFVGAYNSGDNNDPDIVAYGDNIRYEINPPTGFTNAQFTSQWTFDYLRLETVNGTLAPGAAFTTVNPAGGANAYVSFTPTLALSDSFYVLRYAIRSVANGCVAPQVNRHVFVAPRPVVTFSASPVCEGDITAFNNGTQLSSGSISYMWYFGDGDSSWRINPEHTYAQAGTYNVELRGVSNYGYSHSYQTTVTVNENPTVEFGFQNACEGKALTFSDASIIPSGTPTYRWDFGDNTTASSVNPTKTYAVPGVYEVKLTVTSNGCSATTSRFVTQAPRATVSASAIFGSCNNEPVNFSSNGSLSGAGSIGYTWKFGDGNEANGQNIRYEYQDFGQFTAWVIVTTDFGCMDSASTVVTLSESPVSDFSYGSICDKGNVTFTNTSTEPAGVGTSYEWEFSDGTNFNVKNVTRSFNAVGSYDVKLKAISANGCVDEKIAQISVDEKPTAVFYVEDVCAGSPLAISNASTGNMGNFTYNWELNGNTSSQQDPAFSLTTPGTYTLNLTITTPSGCADTEAKQFAVKAVPVAQNVAVTSGTLGNGTMVFTFDNATPGASYLWQFGDGGRESGVVPGNGSVAATYRFINDGLYNATLRITKDGCSGNYDADASVTRTSVKDIAEAGIRVYPNPSNGVVFVDLSRAEEVNRLEVYSVTGQLVKVLDAADISTQTTLDLSAYQAGTYLVRVISATGTFSTKISIQ